MNFLDIDGWNWCAQEGVQGILKLVMKVVNIIRYIVPIALIVMTTLDIIKKVINPDDKDGQKKIMNRAIAAVIVFFIPLLIKFIFVIIDWGIGSGETPSDAYANIEECLSVQKVKK